MQVSSGMLFLYCFGAIVSPIFASILMTRYGAEALFVQNGVMHLILVAFALWRIAVRDRAPGTKPFGGLRKPEPGLS